MLSVIAVISQATRERLAVLCGNQEHIAQAPVFLAWCADLARLDRACRLRGYEQVTQYVESFLLAAVDTSLAMQTAALAGDTMGLGVCYIGAIRNHPQEVIDLLELPRLVFPIVGMTLGWPAVEPKVRPRLPLSAVLHWERYNRSREDKRWPNTTGPWLLRESTMAGKWRFRARKVKMGDYGWTEHSARHILAAGTARICVKCFFRRDLNFASRMPLFGQCVVL